MRPIVFVAVTALSATASANPRALPFTYTTDTLPEGGVEIEQFADLIPLTVAAATGGNQTYLASVFQTEIEIGLRERLELGLYFTYVPGANGDQFQGLAVLPEGNGLKQRLRYIFADPGQWPIDVGVYGELTENERELEFEGKVLLQRRFDRLRIAANLVAEYEVYFSHQRDVVIDPSAGATYELSPKLSVGVDSFLRGEYPRNPPPPMRVFGLGPELYVGPAVMTSFGKLWWSVGAYARVTDTAHELQPGEVYGKLWFRSMIGYNL